MQQPSTLPSPNSTHSRSFTSFDTNRLENIDNSNKNKDWTPRMEWNRDISYKITLGHNKFGFGFNFNYNLPLISKRVVRAQAATPNTCSQCHHNKKDLYKQWWHLIGWERYARHLYAVRMYVCERVCLSSLGFHCRNIVVTIIWYEATVSYPKGSHLGTVFKLQFEVKSDHTKANWKTVLSYEAKKKCH